MHRGNLAFASTAAIAVCATTVDEDLDNASLLGPAVLLAAIVGFEQRNAASEL